MTGQNFQKFYNLIQTKERFIIGCHVHPDGDSIGSMLALGLSLAMAGKKVEMVCQEDVPSVFEFLEGQQLIRKQQSLPPEVLISVDCAEKDRLAMPSDIWETPGLVSINIDHHVTNLGFADYNFIDANASATGELIYRLLKEGNLPVNQAVATAVYTAIATDTGFFRFANTSSLAFELAAGLVRDYRIEPAKVAEQVHEQKSFNSVRLLGEVLSTLQLGNGGRVAWMLLSQKMLALYPVENEETESFVSYARSIEGVEIGILFKELKPGEIKLSWRSTSAVDVSKLAGYFGGGGHARAAGCNINGSIDEVVANVLNFVTKYYETETSVSLS